MPTQQIRVINGVVRTSEPVWQNIERLSEASVAWFTYDVHTGLYSWVINQAGNSVASITEADIIGPIQISGSSLTNQYNSVEVEYPNTEIRDQPHYARIELPQYLRNAFEPDNTLQMTSEFINNQPQAEHLAMITLKQSRLDRSVTINMDYTRINLRAGDIIAITSDTYGWTAKEFRIMRVREVEGNDGSLILEFQLTEYDDTIYDGDFSQFLVGGAPGIRSLGSIGQPGQPTVTLTTVDSLPAQSVDSTVPAGVVDRMQFWAGNVSITGNVNTTEFDLVGTVAPPNANGFTAGDTATFVTTSLRDGTWTWKTRGINTVGTGPFSLLSGNTQYSRNQAPDVIKVGTPIVNANGTTIAGSTANSYQFTFSSAPLDLIQFNGNGVYKGLIYTADAHMCGVGTQVANVSRIVAPASNCALTISHNTTLLTDAKNATGTKFGVALYWSQATWNESVYANSGFAGLSWSNWKLIGLSLDSGNYLSGNMRVTTSTNSIFDNTNRTGNIIAFGVSGAVLPQNWIDIVPSPDPNTGVPTINYTVGFSGNTVIFDAQGGVGNGVYQFPGTVSNNISRPGTQLDSWINYAWQP